MKPNEFLSVLAASCAVSSACNAQLVTNGGFESPALTPSQFQTINVGAEPAGFAWTVVSGNVDVAYPPIPPFVQFGALEGNQALDLNGTQRGTISQTFATTVATRYRLSFVYTDNPFEGGVSSASIAVADESTAIARLNDSVSHSTATNSPPEPDAETYAEEFTAFGTTTRLTLASTSASNSASGGILIDGVSIEELPPCPADITSTGTTQGDPTFGFPDARTDLADLLFFVNVWSSDLGSPSPNPGSLADTTTTGATAGDPGFGTPDGDVDLADLLFYVNEWNAGLSECP